MGRGDNIRLDFSIRPNFHVLRPGGIRRQSMGKSVRSPCDLVTGPYTCCGVSIHQYLVSTGTGVWVHST
jgi:hypothetical protein